MPKGQGGSSIPQENSYEEWRDLLLAEKILSKNGLIDLEKLEEIHPGELSEKQIIWIEAMQKGEVIEKGGDDAVGVDPGVDPTPATVAPRVDAPKRKAKAEPSEPEAEKTEETEEIEETEESLRIAKVSKEKKTYEIGDTLKIQVEADADPEEVTVVRVARDGIHLTSSVDKNTEYLVAPEELKEMIVE